MAYATNKLSDPEIKSAKAKDKKYRLRDGGNLYLEILVSGSKVWRYQYKHGGKDKTFTIGRYPNVSLKAARQARDTARQKLSEGLDPSAEKQLIKNQLSNTSFQLVAESWLKEHKAKVSESTFDRLLRYFRKDVYPVIGMCEVSEINAPHIIPIIKTISDRGAIEAAKRVKQFISQAFNYAVVHGYAERNPAKDIDTNLILPPRVKEHFSSVTKPVQIGKLMRDIDGYQGGVATKTALWLSPYVFLRPGELRAAEWSEIDLDAGVWTLPAKRRKLPTHIKKANRAEDALIIPLASQVIEKLRCLEQYTGRGTYLFPSPQSRSKPISNNAVRVALRTMGYENSDMTAHGFRALASTQLNTLGYRSEVIEAQLGHKEKNQIRAAYNRADYLEERTTMMQQWADYLDSLRDGAQVIPIKKAK